MLSPSTEGVFDALKELTKEQALDFLMDKAILAILGVSPNGILLFFLKPVIGKVFEVVVEPMIDLMYRKAKVAIYTEKGKWTIKRIAEAESNEEIWDIIHSTY